MTLGQYVPLGKMSDIYGQYRDVAEAVARWQGLHDNQKPVILLNNHSALDGLERLIKSNGLGCDVIRTARAKPASHAWLLEKALCEAQSDWLSA